MPDVPLHTDAAADPARRRTIVSRFDFYTAIQVHRAFTVLVIAEGLDGQRQQRRPLLGEHSRDLPLGGAMDARVGPACFPMVQVGLRLLGAFEAQSLNGVICAWPTPLSTFPLRSGSATRQGIATTP